MRSLLFKTFFLVTVLLVGFPGAVFAGSISLSPASGTFQDGKTFSVRINVSSPDQAVNAASGVLSFPPDKLRIVALSKGESILSLWVQEPSYSNSLGTVNFEGVVPNPGFTGSSGNILTVTFKVIGQGVIGLKFTSGSLLANNGEGTNVANNLLGASYTLVVAPPEEKKVETPSPTITPSVAPTPVVEVTPTPIVTTTPVPVVHKKFVMGESLWLLLLIILLALFLLFVMYLLKGFAGVKRKVWKDSIEAAKDIHDEFDELKDLIRNELIPLGRNENSVFEKISRHLTRAEKNILHKIDEVKKDVK